MDVVVESFTVTPTLFEWVMFLKCERFAGERGERLNSLCVESDIKEKDT